MEIAALQLDVADRATSGQWCMDEYQSCNGKQNE
jgi:hypothetical protein